MRIALLFALLAVACSAPPPDTRLAAGNALRSPSATSIPTPVRIPTATLRVSAPATPCGTEAPSGAAGRWLPSSVTLIADRGSATAPSIASISGLCLETDGTWRYGASATGKWQVAQIAPDDWKRWAIPAQNGLTQKIVLADWNGGPAEGPLADGTQLTLVTRVGPPDYAAAGTLSIIFGR